MTGRDFKGAIVSGVAIGLCMIAVMRQPVSDAEQQAKAIAAMNAKLHAKYAPLLAEGERLTFPVSSYRDHK